ncbi:hypothetical protein EDB89DRAFT_1582304 [Lactarius sanguifluus]|nr:hypothetical protein EDB89DRAFT_1582304 [Lactarius sanguifluus]
MTESLPNHYIHAHSHTRTSMPVKPAYHICTTVRQRKVVTERRRATPRPLGRRPLRELLIIHTGVGSFLETRRVGEGLCADKVKNSRRLQHLLLRFFDAELALSYGPSGPIGARVCCTCSANHDFPLPRRTGPRRRAAHNGKRVPSLGCAGTDGECLSRGPPRSRLIAVEVLLVTGGARGRFPPCLACIHRLSTHMERRAPLSSKHRRPTSCAGMHGRGSKRERKNESAAGGGGLLRVLSPVAVAYAVLCHNARLLYGPAPPPLPTDALLLLRLLLEERTSHSSLFIIIMDEWAQARASKRRTQSCRSDSLFGGLYHRYVRRRHHRRRCRRRRRHACLSPAVGGASTRAGNTGLVASCTVTAVLQYAV